MNTELKQRVDRAKAEAERVHLQCLTWHCFISKVVESKEMPTAADIMDAVAVFKEHGFLCEAGGKVLTDVCMPEIRHSIEEAHGRAVEEFTASTLASDPEFAAAGEQPAERNKCFFNSSIDDERVLKAISSHVSSKEKLEEVKKDVAQHAL